MTDEIILKMEGISKAFPGVQALQKVDFDLKKAKSMPGRRKWAGKSTLIKILAGVYRLMKATSGCGANACTRTTRKP
jgi:ABC-type sugar transport system ATPase subunit